MKRSVRTGFIGCYEIPPEKRERLSFPIHTSFMLGDEVHVGDHSGTWVVVGFDRELWTYELVRLTWWLRVLRWFGVWWP